MADDLNCPLGDDCDLTLAYMVGYERGKDAIQSRIKALERENKLQAQEIDKTRRRADKWQGMVIDCEQYLKPGETPRQRMDRDCADVLSLMKLLEKEKYRAEAAEVKLEKAVKAMEAINDKVSWEINPSNYTHADVCDMNSDWCDIGNRAEFTLAELKKDE